MTTTSAKVWTEKQARMSHGKTRYWEAGTGTPTILLHGAGWNSGCESWALTIGPLAKRDLPGHAEGFAKVMRHMTNPLTRQRYNTLRRLPFITVPTLVVWGRDDPVNSMEEVGMPTANGIPGAKLIVYDNTGHSVPWEQPERFPSDVLAFLTS
jgi:pimeloyl-ACP methyl ester carboxylesterase